MRRRKSHENRQSGMDTYIHVCLFGASVSAGKGTTLCAPRQRKRDCRDMCAIEVAGASHLPRLTKDECSEQKQATDAPAAVRRRANALSFVYPCVRTKKTAAVSYFISYVLSVPCPSKEGARMEGAEAHLAVMNLW